MSVGAVKKLASSAFEAIKSAELKKVFDLFKSNGYQVRIAGGAVRDLLSDKVPEDVDLATTATPDQMKAMFQNANLRMINAGGEKHGTVTVRINDCVNYEITTLRIDAITDGRHAQVVFTDDWRLDANRRDLTVNSIFLDEDGTIIDFFNGYDDLKNHRIRFVGEADVRIREDYLRILRYFRFYPRICLDESSHDSSALTAIKANASGLNGVAGERLWVELKKIVRSRFADSLMTKMQETDVLKNIGFPDVCNLSEFSRVYRNFHNDLASMPLPMTMTSALLHNYQEFEALHKRLKFSNDEKRLAEIIIKYRDVKAEQGSPSQSKKLKNSREESVRTFKYLVVENSKDSKIKSKERIIELLKYTNRCDLIEEIESWTVPDFPVKGGVLIERNIPRGPVYARVLESLRRLWMYEFDLDTSEETVQKLVEKCDELVQTYKKSKP